MASDEHGHSHAHDLDVVVDGSAARLLRWAAIACGVLIVIGAILLWPDGGASGQDPLSLRADPLDAHVTEVVEGQCLR